MTVYDISILVESELARIVEPSTVALIRSLLVPPRCEQRPWDYGVPDTTYPCWIIAEHPESNTCVSYCEHGFGPESPWGLLFICGKYMSMGMDCGWFSTLEAAVRDSMAWA